MNTNELQVNRTIDGDTHVEVQDSIARS